MGFKNELFFEEKSDPMHPMKKKNSKLNAVSEILKNSENPSDAPASSLFKCIQLNQNWTKIVGSKWGSVSKPVGYTHKCLTIQVPSACHIQEMSFDKEIFIQKINKFSGSHFVRDIRWIPS